MISYVLHRPAFVNYGVWDTIRVDHGREFFLSLFVQEKISHLRTNTSRVPYLQTTSKQVNYLSVCVEIIPYFIESYG